MAKSQTTTPAPGVRDLCRQWRYIAAKSKADIILAKDDDEIDRLMSEAEEQLRAIEAKLAKAKPKGASDAYELLHVVLDLIADDSVVDGRDRALLHRALTAVAWAEWPEPEEPAPAPADAPEPAPAPLTFQQAWRLAWDMEKPVSAAEDYATTLMLLSTDEDLEEPHRKVLNRLSHDMLDHVREIEDQRMRLVSGLRTD